LPPQDAKQFLVSLSEEMGNKISLIKYIFDAKRMESFLLRLPFVHLIFEAKSDYAKKTLNCHLSSLFVVELMAVKSSFNLSFTLQKLLLIDNYGGS